MNTTSPLVGIIGGGPAGLTAAYHLGKRGVASETWEADPEYVGGISRTVVYRGFRFDIGGHRFFSKSQEIEDLWSEILGHDLVTRKRLSRIFFGGKFYSYPLEASEVVANLGKREALLCLASYLKAKLNPSREQRSLEEWVTNKFGARLYRAFFQSYTEKVWGIPCSEISADWAAQRIKGLSLSRAALAALFSQGRPAAAVDRASLIKTLIGSFRYPRLGPGMMWETAAARIRSMGSPVTLDSRVTGLILDQATRKWMLELATGGGGGIRRVAGPYDHVISSAPLHWLIGAIRPGLPEEAVVAAAGLRYRDFLTVALILRPATVFPDQWLYIHEPNLMVGRIQNFSNWSPEMVPDPELACYGLEYFCFREDALWNLTDKALIELATRELEILGLARPGDVLDGAVVRQPRAYPVYDDNYQASIRIIRQALRDHCPGLHPVGRNGMHKYNNQDHSMMTALLTAENILAGQMRFDPWRVNQDAEYIEEEGDPAGVRDGGQLQSV